MELAHEPIFVSAEHMAPHVAQIGRLDGALLLGSQQVAFVDGIAQALGFVDVVTGTTWTVQEEGVDAELGPMLRLLDRFDGLIVTDRNGSVTVFDTNGEIVENREYDPFAVSFAAPAMAVGMFPDRRLLFRRSDKAPVGFSLAVLAGPEGLQRDTVRYETPVVGGTATVVARALDDEKMFLTTRVDGVTSSGAERIIFGHRLLETRVGERLVIVQTDRAETVVYDRGGRQVAAFPMPVERSRMTDETVETQRALRIKEKERENEAKRKAKERSFAENFGAVYSPGRDSLRIARLPANDVSPPVDRLIGDLDGRVWLRLFPMPNDTVVYWRVWSIGHRVPDFQVTLPRAKRLLDASGDLLLLQTTSDTGTDQFVIQEIVTVTDSHDQLPARSNRSSHSYTPQPCLDVSRHNRRER